jgi:hypothetical protein
MERKFKVGDHVSWNSEAGRVRGTIKKKVTSPIKFKNYTVRASKEEPPITWPCTKVRRSKRSVNDIAFRKND